MKKILVIEDEDVVRTSIIELLEASNYKVFSASDGKEGLQLASEIMPDLIICDIMMPKLDGYEVIKKLKLNPDFYYIPFIFLTAKAEVTDFRNGMEIGADDYITKPFRADTLLKAISTRLEKFGLMRAQNRKQEKSTGEKDKNLMTENDKIFVNVNNKPQIIKIGDILSIKANGEYSDLFLVSGSKLIVRKLLKQWEDQLPDNIFLRIHRSTIINMNYIEKIEKWYNRSYIIFLKNTEEKFVISQRYSSKIKSRFFV